MTRQLDIATLLDRWLEDGPSEVPDRVVERALERVERTPQRRPRLTRRLTRRYLPAAIPSRLAIAAALIAAVGVSLLFFGPLRPSASPAVAPTPSPTVSPAATATRPAASPASPSASHAGQVGGGTSLAVRAATQAGVTYTIDGPPVSFTLKPGAGWWLINNMRTLITFVRGPNEPNPPDELTIQLAQPARVVPPGNVAPIAAPADLVAWLRARPDLSLTAPSAIVVGGIDGALLEGEIRAGATVNSTGGLNLICTAESNCGWVGGEIVGFPANHRFQIVVLDVYGTHLVIALDAPKTGWAASRQLLDAFLKSLTFVRGS